MIPSHGEGSAHRGCCVPGANLYPGGLRAAEGGTGCLEQGLVEPPLQRPCSPVGKHAGLPSASREAWPACVRLRVRPPGNSCRQLNAHVAAPFHALSRVIVLVALPLCWSETRSSVCLCVHQSTHSTDLGPGRGLQVKVTAAGQGLRPGRGPSVPTASQPPGPKPGPRTRERAAWGGGTGIIGIGLGVSGSEVGEAAGFHGDTRGGDMWWEVPDGHRDSAVPTPRSRRS